MVFDPGWLVYQREFGDAAIALDNDPCFLTMRHALIAQARYANAVSTDAETAQVIINRYRATLLGRYRGLVLQRSLAA